jgi:transposase
MANRIKMAVENAILGLWKQNWSLRRIARELGIDRGTVTRHVRVELERASKPANVTAGTEGTGAAKPANVTAGKLTQKSRCEGFRELIEEKLKAGLSAQRVWQDLFTEHGFTGSYSAVKRYVRRLGQASPLPFRRMECAAGEEAQVDFGRGAAVEEGNRRRIPHLFRIILSHSRKGYSEVVWRQNTETFIRCLENAFRHFGGVPKTLIVDNLKAAVIRPDWYDPELNPKISDFCRHYGTVMLPAKPYTPRHKGKVEGGVKYAQNNALKGRTFTSLAAENEHLAEWEKNVADGRIHGTTKKQVRVLFGAECPSLLPLPAMLFPCFEEGPRSVHRDAHIEVDKAYYSVPPEYRGRTVWARWDAKMVRIYNDRLQPIATHLRQEYGRFRTDPLHIAAEKISAVERGAGYLLKRVSRVGEQTGRWASAMLDRRGIEGVRVLVGLLAMTNKYTSRQMETACAAALTHDVFRLKSLRALIKEPDEQQEFVQAHPLIRPMSDYGRYVKVSFGKEVNPMTESGVKNNDEFTALRAACGAAKEKSLALPQALPAVQPPVAALRSLSSGALSSVPAGARILGRQNTVNDLGKENE